MTCQLFAGIRVFAVELVYLYGLLINGLMGIRPACSGEIIQFIPGQFPLLSPYLMEVFLEIAFDFAETGKIRFLKFAFNTHMYHSYLSLSSIITYE